MAIFLKYVASKGFKEKPTLKFEMVCLTNRLSIQYLQALKKKKESSGKHPFSTQAFQGQTLCRDV